MPAYDCIECLLPLVIVQYLAFIANIIDKLLERLQISKTVKVVARAVVFLVVAHPMCTGAIFIV